MTYSIDEIKNLILQLDSQRNTLPSDILEILSELEKEYETYNHSHNSENRETSLINLDGLVTRYYKFKEIMQHLEREASIEIPDYSEYLNYTGTESVDDLLDSTAVDTMLEKVHMESALRDPNNIMHQIFKATIGWWFENNDTITSIRQFNLKYAKGVWLDELAYQYGLSRRTDETDDELRNRILALFKEKFIVPYIIEVGLKIFTKVHGNPYENLTSRNTFLTNDYFVYGDYELENYFNKRYITWRDIIWL